MSATSTAITVLGHIGLPGAMKIEAAATEITQVAKAERKAEARVEKPARQVGWHSAEWWEHRNYERR